MAAVCREFMTKPNNNSIQILRPWKEGSTWMFDDEEIGVRREAFVGGASEMITALMDHFGVSPNQDGKIDLIFSHLPFPKAEQLTFVSGDTGGVIFSWNKMVAWFCPCFFNYFDRDNVPTNLYAQVA
jgi:hypothetical protein